MTAVDYIKQLASAKNQAEIEKLMNKGLRDGNLLPHVFQAMCLTAKSKGFQLTTLQLF